MTRLEKMMDNTTLFSLVITFGAFGAISAFITAVIMMLTA